MEMDGVRTENESLANKCELNTINTAGSRLITRRVADNDCTILVVWRMDRVTTVYNITGEKADLSAHLNRVFVCCAFTEGLHTSVMLS